MEYNKKWYEANKEKIKERSRLYYLNNKKKIKDNLNSNPEKKLAKTLKRYYGITLADYYSMIEKQNGNCAICQCSLDDPLRNSSKANVDHDHKTGKIRGIVHGKCNTAIALFSDNPIYCDLAAKYLREHENKCK